MQTFISGQTPAIAEPYRLTSLAGALAFADAGIDCRQRRAGALARKVADFIVPQQPGEVIRFATGWTDDMFMASCGVVAGRHKARTQAVVGRLLTSYAGKLQRPDGLFIHAVDGPHAWGRGNGFALLGVTEALTYLPDNWSDRAARARDLSQAVERARDASIRRRQLATGRGRAGELSRADGDGDDGRGAWRAAYARLDRSRHLRADHQPRLDRGGRARQCRRHREECLFGHRRGTDKEYYLNRPVVNGADDRGGAMALLAAIEMETMRRAPR